MDTIHLVAWAARNRLSWLLKCWALRKQVAALAAEAGKCAEDAHLLASEVAMLKGQLQTELAKQQLAKDGNRALLRFIHARHRLNMKFDADSIRSALQHADQKPNEKKTPNPAVPAATRGNGAKSAAA